MAEFSSKSYLGLQVENFKLPVQYSIVKGLTSIYYYVCFEQLEAHRGIGTFYLNCQIYVHIDLFVIFPYYLRVCTVCNDSSVSLVMCVPSFLLVSLARGVPILLTSSKNQLFVSLIFSTASVFNFMDYCSCLSYFSASIGIIFAYLSF